MNIENFPQTIIKQYKTEEDVGSVGEQLKSIVSNYGLSIFNSPENLLPLIDNLRLERNVKSQLKLIFSGSSLYRYLINATEDLFLADLNNALHIVIEETGLCYNTALRLLTDIFYACGHEFSIEEGPQSTSDDVKTTLHALMTNKAADSEIKRVERLIREYNKSKNAEAASLAVASINNLCKAGISKGFYLLGKCYLYGECGTELDKEKGLKYLNIAEAQGIPEASTALGDYYYNQIQNNTKAHYYYTRPGAMPIGSPQRAILKDIYEQKSKNKVTLILGAGVIILMIVFLVFFHTGIFSNSGRLTIGIILTVLATCSYAGGVIIYLNEKYDNIRPFITGQYILWAIYAFILLLA